jgi:UDP-N-acetylmuramate--alanine ligase
MDPILRLNAYRDRLAHAAPGYHGPLLLVSVPVQTLYYLDKTQCRWRRPVSTARRGTGAAEGSLKTPPGIHRIVEKIGAGAPRGRIFTSRRDTGVDWRPGMTDDNLILTRILRLEGLEPGINRGPGIDSFERYIYIHGTNQEERIGEPLSHGCVCMRNDDIVELFDRIEEGAVVIID